MPMTKQQLKTAFLVSIIGDAIQEAGEEGIPSGHLYARLCGEMSLEIYQTIIDGLERGGIITINGFLLKIVGR